MRKTVLRYAGALLVSVISTYTGLSRFALAEAPDVPACSLTDVSAWQAALTNPTEEVTPAYTVRVTEAFIDRCPDRPEVPEAHRLAAMSSVWDGNAEAAVSHFEQVGTLTDSKSLLLYTAASLAIGEDDAAWKLRDAAISSWLERLARRRQADIKTTETRGGLILSVTFRQVDADNPTSQLWLAWPHRAGWPAALSVSSEAQLNAFHRLRAGEDAADVKHVRLYRCRARRLLARTTETVSPEDIEETAILAMQAYLAAPDRSDPGTLQTCIFDERILPDIHPARAVPIQ
ncbi:hypothetical protein [Henriciella litoralis]|uniref:hypothetical protein n=1 Tax=Henriciella litoralis TaxID=568102 RepID=UPI000A004EC3|nr:hypothetical protein [Henriciella litoralis]